MTARALRSLWGIPRLLPGHRYLASRRSGFIASLPQRDRDPRAECLRRAAVYGSPAPYTRITLPPDCCLSAAYTMAASGKIDLNSPSISWKEAKNYLKGLKEKQRREHYAVKDFIKLKEIPSWKDTAKKTNAKQPEEVKFPKNKDLNEKISLFRGDITKLEVDAIVNAANTSLLGGGGVDGCIHRTAGPLLKLECSSLGGCETGQAKMTCGYLLPAKWVIHTVGPVAQGHPGPSQEQDLMNCYNNSMYLASESKLRTLAFPCISTGVFGYPAEDAADVALGTIRKYLEDNKDKFDRIIICVFLEKDEEIYRNKLPEYFPLGSADVSSKL